MKLSDVPFAVLRFQYQLARLPLQVIEDRVFTRISQEAPARLFYERSLGMLDATAGSALRDPDLAERGAALVERSNALGRAVELDTEAEARKQAADEKLERRRYEAIELRQDAVDATAQELEEARDTAEKRKANATQAARQKSASVKRKVDETAAQRKEAAESAARQVEEETLAAEQAAAEVAKAKLDDAAELRSEAADKRANADQVEDLADAQKETDPA
jgi:hypothetical protein